MVPFDAEPTLRILEANVFYTSPNVSAAKSNSKLKSSVITSGTVAGENVSTTDHVITFDDGLCSLADINAELVDYLESKSSIADAALSFVGHGPTQTVVADWDAEAATYGIILRFSESDSVASLLGFAATDLTYEYSEGGKHKTQILSISFSGKFRRREPLPAQLQRAQWTELWREWLRRGAGRVCHHPERGPGESDPISAVHTPPVPGARVERQSDELDSIYNDRQQQRASGFERGVHRAYSD